MKMKRCHSIIILFICLLSSYCQGQSIPDSSSKYTIGFRYSFYYDFEVKHDYNFKVEHHIPICSFGFGNHNIYIGPQYSYIFQPTPIANEIYEKNSYGLNFGYRYYFNELIKKLRLFGQFNFSIYQIKYNTYQRSPTSVIVTDQKKLIVENTATIGIDYKIFKRVYLFSGVGIGSFSGFFLMINDFNISCYIGLEYKFN